MITFHGDDDADRFLAGWYKAKRAAAVVAVVAVALLVLATAIRPQPRGRQRSVLRLRLHGHDGRGDDGVLRAAGPERGAVVILSESSRRPGADG